MANQNGGRVCPKCGTKLGQKNICPICGGPERKKENGNGADSAQDYVSSVIDFVADHPDDWDDEFNTFFDGFAEKPDFDECYEACSRTCEIFRTEIPDSGKISGSMTRKAMTDLRSVFPDLTSETARALALNMLKKRMESAQDGPGENGEIIGLNRDRAERFRQKTESLLSFAKPLNFDAMAESLKEMTRNYPDYFECCSGMIISRIAELTADVSDCKAMCFTQSQKELIINPQGFSSIVTHLNQIHFDKALFLGQIEEGFWVPYTNVQVFYKGGSIDVTDYNSETIKKDGMVFIPRPSESRLQLPGRNTLVFLIDNTI